MTVIFTGSRRRPNSAQLSSTNEFTFLLLKYSIRIKHAAFFICETSEGQNNLSGTE